VNAEANHTLDNLGIAKTHREEVIRARDAKLKQDGEDQRMAKLYNEHILGIKQPEGMVAVDSIAPAQPATKKEEGELVTGD
jgi:7,8-dihydro-6-hydroxymethylpterin dimethyltransferase